MRVKAKVIRLEGKYAIVESERLSACEGCHKSAEGCSVCSLMGGNRIITSKAKNTVGAKIGDVVEIETEAKTILFYALIVFVLPVITMLAFYFASALFTVSEIYRYIFAFLGFVLTFIGLWLYSKFRVEKKCDSEIVSIESENDE